MNKSINLWASAAWAVSSLVCVAAYCTGSGQWAMTAAFNAAAASFAFFAASRNQ